jgi:NADH-quinone oxidoreductase subunit C
MLPEQLKDHATAREVEARFGSAVLGGKVVGDENTLFLDPAQIVPVCRFLKDEMKFIRLSGITGLDWLHDAPRFELNYHLHSLERNERLRLKCRVPESKDPVIESVFSVWRSADWFEREIFDMFGVVFSNHPNLQRILMPLDWEGHPLRKDYPVHGYKYTYGQDETMGSLP